MNFLTCVVDIVQLSNLVHLSQTECSRIKYCTVILCALVYALNYENSQLSAQSAWCSGGHWFLSCWRLEFFPVAQWIEHPRQVWVVMGSIPVACVIDKFTLSQWNFSCECFASVSYTSTLQYQTREAQSEFSYLQLHHLVTFLFAAPLPKLHVSAHVKYTTCSCMCAGYSD